MSIILFDEMVKGLVKDCDDLDSLCSEMMNLCQDQKGYCALSSQEDGWDRVVTSVSHIASHLQRKRQKLEQVPDMPSRLPAILKEQGI